MNRHRHTSRIAGSVAILTVWLSAGCPKSEPPPPTSTAQLTAPSTDPDEARLAIFKPALPAEFLNPANAFSEDKVALGRMLYYDKRLSKNHDVSCNSCHDLITFGVDGKRVSIGHKKQTGSRNSPTVYNAAGHFTQFWDGRAKDVEEQAMGPVLNPVEMAIPAPAQVEACLQSIPQYVDLFKKVYPGDAQPVTLAHAASAIAAFERRLVTPSRWDKYLGGDKSALTDVEKAGLNKFMKVGCPTCHLGTLMGGAMFQKAGLVKAWPNMTDKGRGVITKNSVDEMFFKVPSLRNVEKTAPYFHDGSVEKLEDAVRQMARHQLGQELTDPDIGSIVAFLKTLTGTIPVDYIKMPEMFPSSPKTPKPDPS